jgi:hypothetical protein
MRALRRDFGSFWLARVVHELGEAFAATAR